MPHDRPAVPRARGRQRLRRLLVGAPLAVLATGCDGAKVVRGGWPSPVTTEGDHLLGLWRGSLIAGLCVAFFVGGLIVFSSIAYHKRRDSDEIPRQVRYNVPIEVLYTAVPIVIISVLFYFTALRENDTVQFNQQPDLRVGVVGFQWSWQFNYLDDGLSVTGRPGQPPQLVIPVGEKIRFYETSPDVIHSWWTIPFLFKRDVIPGRTNTFQVTVTKTGVFKGKCAEYCGVDHDRMLFSVMALPRDQYQQWLAKAKATAQSSSTSSQYTVYSGSLNTPSTTGLTQRSHQ